MEALFGTDPNPPRSIAPRRELALDLTASEVVLYEGGAGDWRRFAGVALEDPEFLGVLALLRAEAEAALGGPAPVRLWLPADQVLRLTARLGAGTRAARLEAAFARAGAETRRPPEELAVAIGAPSPGGETVVLVTYAATWREARAYAARWGFAPGPVSTRHHAEGFGAAEPEFHLVAGRREAVPAGPPLAARLALALMAAPAAALASPAPEMAPQPPARAQTELRLAPSLAPGLVPGVIPDLTLGRAPSLAPDLARGLAPMATPTPSPDAASGAAAGTPSQLPLARPAPADAGGMAAPLPRARPDRPGARGTAPAFPSVAAAGATAGETAGETAPTRAAAAQGLPADRAALIGVVELESGRQALLRLPGGSYRSVRVGDEIEGWKVSAISRDALRVSRGAESQTLLLISR